MARENPGARYTNSAQRTECRLRRATYLDKHIPLPSVGPIHVGPTIINERDRLIGGQGPLHRISSDDARIQARLDLSIHPPWHPSEAQDKNQHGGGTS
eukprot:COSAG02_NODE_33389_length_500_cov_2.079800_1_plen_97_part_10